VLGCFSHAANVNQRIVWGCVVQMMMCVLDVALAASVSKRSIRVDHPIGLDCRSTESAKGSMIHEVAHVMGLGHEHKRSDRDNFVTINWDSITAQWRSQYAFSELIIRRALIRPHSFEFFPRPPPTPSPDEE
jgi:hypothetical protein